MTYLSEKVGGLMLKYVNKMAISHDLWFWLN